MYAGFLHTFFGKSMTYLFLGVLVLQPPNTNNPIQLFEFIAGIVIIFIAFLYFIFQFCSGIERPRPMYYSGAAPAAV